MNESLKQDVKKLLEQKELYNDIESFRNIIQVLRSYKTVGNRHPEVDFGSSETDDHYPVALDCILYEYTDENGDEAEPSSYQDLVENSDIDSTCSIFYHLVESKEVDKNGVPTFQSLKFWGGYNDFMYPEFEWVPELGVWKAESYTYFEFKKPFKFDKKYQRPLREDLAEQTVSKLASDKSWFIESLGGKYPLD